MEAPLALLLSELENPLFLAECGSELDVSDGSSKLGTVRMVEGCCCLLAPLSDFGEFVKGLYLASTLAMLSAWPPVLRVGELKGEAAFVGVVGVLVALASAANR